jgi:hypothetical protein
MESRKVTTFQVLTAASVNMTASWDICVLPPSSGSDDGSTHL